jgi:hypothetical protein
MVGHRGFIAARFGAVQSSFNKIADRHVPPESWLSAGVQALTVGLHLLQQRFDFLQFLAVSRPVALPQ